MKKTVLLIGCGNIGLRHLQALSSLQNLMRILVVEPHTAAREKAQSAIADTPTSAEIEFLSDWNSVPAEVDLAIIATPAGPRRKVLEQLLSVTKPAFLILEKILFTTHRDLNEVGEMLEARGIPTVVNCGRRGFADYDKLRDTLASRAGVSMHIHGSGWRLCTSGVHFLDLASQVLGCFPPVLDETGLDEKPVPSNHPNCIEFHGTLEGAMPNGGEFSMTSTREGSEPVVVEFQHGNESWRVEEGQKRLVHVDATGKETITPFDVLYVSGMGHLYAEILEHQRSRLPSYALSAAQHHTFIDAILRRLELPIEEDTQCPIT
jgi:predicted dehydrogenase